MTTLEINHQTLESALVKALTRTGLPPQTNATSYDLHLSHYDCGNPTLVAFEPFGVGEPLSGLGQLSVVISGNQRDLDCATRFIHDNTVASQVWRAWLLLGVNEAREKARAFVLEPGRVSPEKARIVVRGPGLRRAELPASNERSRTWIRAHEIWSRSMAAMGSEAWTELTTSNIEIVGCGRTGSTIAGQLANLGCRSIGLIDPDVVEPHNLDASTGLSFEAIGRYKVEAVADFLEATYPWTSAYASVVAAGSQIAIKRIKSADLVIVAVDNLASLLQTETLCKLYGKPLVSIGTRLRRDRVGFDVTADIGVFFSGAPGCSICMGPELPDLRQALKAVAFMPEPPQFARSHLRRGDFREERAGSLLSVNSMAIGLAIHAIQSGHGGGAAISDRSYTMRLNFDPSGRPEIKTTSVDIAYSLSQCLCGFTNAGDIGLKSLGAMVTTLARARRRKSVTGHRRGSHIAE